MKAPNFFWTLIALILGVTLYRKFDFENFTFEQPALAIVYVIVLVAAIFMIVKDYKDRPRK
ncbi:MAG: membrane protein DedA with SNARE-associated domain [Spirosomataceae bacterium]|jgi:membrane protein DedA with SNARE-associated domain